MEKYVVMVEWGRGFDRISEEYSGVEHDDYKEAVLEAIEAWTFECLELDTHCNFYIAERM